MGSFTSFTKHLKERGLGLGRRGLKTLQINMGKLCNQACHHCHVDAGPGRKEMMTKKTVERLIELIGRATAIETVDITGGAPELHPHFRDLVRSSCDQKKQVIDRCNLTVLFEKGQEDTPRFLREYRVKIVSSLPCYLEENVDRQRGGGVFDKSIRALRELNELGYGRKDTGLILDLVYNPIGPYLPPDQAQLEAAYRTHLKKEYGIQFNRLLTITNMPINRFLKDLRRQNRFEEYMEMLAHNFNPTAAEAVMCRDLVSVSWDGFLYDCDFNQMLGIPQAARRRSLWDIESFDEVSSGPIAFGDHCYGCTAGAGSSCGGALV